MFNRLSSHSNHIPASAPNASITSDAPHLHGSHDLQNEITKAQQDFATARKAAYAQHASGTLPLNQKLVEARMQYKTRINQLRAEFGEPLRPVPLHVDNDDDSFSYGEFKVLEHCARFIGGEVFSDFNQVSLYKDEDLDDGVEGQTSVVHPNFEDMDFIPYTEKRAEVSIASGQSLSASIAVLVHEFSLHLIGNMRLAELGEPIQPEEAGHHTCLRANSDFHKAMVSIERNWEDVQALAKRVGEDVSWDEVKSSYLHDIGMQLGTYHTYLGLGLDGADHVTDEYLAGTIEEDKLGPEARFGLETNLFWRDLRAACEDDTPLADIKNKISEYIAPKDAFRGFPGL